MILKRIRINITLTLYFVGSTLECRACVAIEAGSPLTTHYVSPLLDRDTRRLKLRDKWFFDCNCFRCWDTTGRSISNWMTIAKLKNLIFILYNSRK